MAVVFKVEPLLLAVFVLSVRCMSFVLTTLPSSARCVGKSRHFAKSEDISSEVDVDIVSDAEALLACRSYLQRRNRLGEWKNKERKRQSRPALLNSTEALLDADAGFFWPDPSQLKYLYRPGARGSGLSSDDEEEEEEEEEFSLDTMEQSIDNEPSGVETGSKRSSSPPALMTAYSDYQEHKRRSSAARRTWSNPRFRSKWYESRWGQKTRQGRLPEQKQLEARLRSLDLNKFLSSQALANMTEAEIAGAIRKYVSANRKRSVSRQKTVQSRKDALKSPVVTSERLPRDFLLNKDPLELEEARRVRSEKAARAFKSRMKNQGSPSNRKLQKRKQAQSTEESGSDPADALARIEDGLVYGEVPKVDDLKLVLLPTRLANRKKVLLKILDICFDLRGKCIPPPDTLEQWFESGEDGSDWNVEYSFAAKASVGHLGKFVLFRTIVHKR